MTHEAEPFVNFHLAKVHEISGVLTLVRIAGIL